MALAQKDSSRSTESPGTTRPTGRRRMHRAIWGSFLISRVVVIATGMAAKIDFGTPAHLATWWPAPGGYFGSLVFASVERWDSGYFLAVATNGYGAGKDLTAFYPLYPALIHVSSWFVGSPITAGFLISLATFVGALYATYALVRLDFSEDVAVATVLLLAFFPTSLFFSAVYSESLFLLLSVATIYEARRSRWIWAGVLGFLAALTRNSGVFLIVPVAILMLYGPCADGSRRVWRSASSPQQSGWRVLLPKFRPPLRGIGILLIPCGLFVFLGYLQVRYGWGLAPFHAEAAWGRESTNPASGFWQAASAAYESVRQLLHGPPPPAFAMDAGWGLMPSSLGNIIFFAFLILGLVGLVGVFRRQPFAYGAYAFLVIVLSLAEPVKVQPLLSLPRFLMVLFPLFVWAAERLQRRTWLPYMIGASAALLGYCTAMFATWRFVA
jgi:hypothetical protein